MSNIKWIDNENFSVRYNEIDNFSFIEKYRNIFFYSKENLSKEQIDALESIGANLIENSEKCRPFHIEKKKYDIVHILTKDKGVYRREKLNEYLNKRYSVLNLNINNFYNLLNEDFDFLEEIKNQNPLIIFSGYAYNKIAFDFLKENKKIMYDIYDIEKEDNNKIISSSKLITCSSKVIFNSINSENKFYIPNGCTVKEYKPIDKYKTKTAIIPCCNVNKIDLPLLNLLKALNEDWNIEIVGFREKIEEIQEENPDLIIKGWMDEEELHKEMSKCHLGLCLFQVNDITKGQLSDKFFNYVNAHIPTLINEELAPNYEEYKDFVSVLDFDKLELDNYLKDIPDKKYEELLKECNWDNRFDNMFKIVKEQGLL